MTEQPQVSNSVLLPDCAAGQARAASARGYRRHRGRLRVRRAPQARRRGTAEVSGTKKLHENRKACFNSNLLSATTIDVSKRGDQVVRVRARAEPNPNRLRQTSHRKQESQRGVPPVLPTAPSTGTLLNRTLSTTEKPVVKVTYRRTPPSAPFAASALALVLARRGRAGANG